MNRRTLVTLLSGTAAALPLAARAQLDRMRRIGVLMAYDASDQEGQAWVAAFRDGLQKLGWTEGRNIRIDIRWAAADEDLMQQFAKELVALQPDLILTQNTPTTAAMLQQTRTIPIIFANVSDPIGSRFVASFSRPGGNVTGFTDIEATIAGKWLELLKEVAPRTARVAFLFNPATAPFAEYFLTYFKAVAGAFAMEAITEPCSPIRISSAPMDSAASANTSPVSSRSRSLRAAGGTVGCLEADRQSARRRAGRPHHPAVPSRARRRGDRITHWNVASCAHHVVSRYAIRREAQGRQGSGMDVDRSLLPVLPLHAVVAAAQGGVVVENLLVVRALQELGQVRLFVGAPRDRRLVVPRGADIGDARQRHAELAHGHDDLPLPDGHCPIVSRATRITSCCAVGRSLIAPDWNCRQTSSTAVKLDKAQAKRAAAELSCGPRVSIV